MAQTKFFIARVWGDFWGVVPIAPNEFGVSINHPGRGNDII